MANNREAIEVLDPSFAIPREIVKKAAEAACFMTGSDLMTERVMNRVLLHIYTDLIKWAQRPPVQKRRTGDYNRKKNSK